MLRSPRLLDVAAASLLLATGVLVVVLSRRLPYWHDAAPGPGFFPVWLGMLLSVVSGLEIFLILRSPTDASRFQPPPDEGALTRRRAVLGLLSIVAALLVPSIGFVLAMTVFVAGASWIIDPRRPFTNAAATLAIPFCVWLLFAVWLGVPLPRGPLGF
jgi:putative tricarboxylic transport membrane protein